MPIEYRIATTPDVLYARHFGHLRLETYVAAFTSYLQHPSYRLGRPELIDMTGSTSIDANFAAVQQLLSRVNREVPEGARGAPTAIIAPCDLCYGIARQYEAMASMQSGIVVTLHREAGEALQELGLTYRDVAALLADGDFGEPVLIDPDASRGNGTRLTSRTGA